MQNTLDINLESNDSQVKQEPIRLPKHHTKSKEPLSNCTQDPLKLIVYIVDEVNQVITHYASDPLFDQDKIFNGKMYREYVDDKCQN